MKKINKNKYLHRKALEQVKKINQEEKDLIKRISEFSPKYIYLGYIPVNIKAKFQA